MRRQSTRKAGGDGKKGRSHFSDDFDIGRSGAVIRGHGIDNPDDVALHHADVVRVAIALRQVEEVLNEVHDIGTCIHVVLSRLGQHWSFIHIRDNSHENESSAPASFSPTHPLNLLEDA